MGPSVNSLFNVKLLTDLNRNCAHRSIRVQLGTLIINFFMGRRKLQFAVSRCRDFSCLQFALSHEKRDV